MKNTSHTGTMVKWDFIVKEHSQRTQLLLAWWLGEAQ